MPVTNIRAVGLPVGLHQPGEDESRRQGSQARNRSESDVSELSIDADPIGLDLTNMALVFRPGV